MSDNHWFHLRIPLGFFLAGWYLWLMAYASTDLLGLAAALVVSGCVVRSWAAGYLLKNKRLAVGGPYAYVRNPLYSGNFLIGAGFCLALYRSPLPPDVFLFWVVFLVGFVLLYIVKGLSEEEELRRSFGAAYDAYREQVPAFLPVRGRVDGLGQQRYSMELYKRNLEHRKVLGSIALLALLIWKATHVT